MNVRKILKFGKKKKQIQKSVFAIQIFRYIDLYIIFSLYNYYIY